jgi:hypothetical protein
MRYASKRQLLEDIEREHGALVRLLESIPAPRHREVGVWGDGWTIKDLVAHLHEWHLLFLSWYREGLAGGTPALPAPGYKWNQLGELNQAIWRKYCRAARARVLGDFEQSYAEVVALAESLPSSALLSSGRFAWTGKHSLTTYLGASTSSHYRFATKVLKRWLRQQARTGGDVRG